MPNHPPRGLGRDTRETMRRWDAIIATTPVAPRMMGAAFGLRRSPNIRRYYHASYLNQADRGFCVGFNTCGSCMTLLRIPPNARYDPNRPDAQAAPLPLTRLSPLACYAVGRKYAIEVDRIALGNQDGMISTSGMKGLGKWGVARLETMPSDTATVNRHPVNSQPPAKVMAEGAKQLVESMAIGESWAHGLELNKAGFPLNLASECPQGMLSTGPDGKFNMAGRSVGGHLYQLVDHDEDADMAWIAQAWIRWGEKSSAPEFNDPNPRFNMGGYTQLGYCSLTDLASFFTDRNMRTGQSEITVANVIGGFDRPKIRTVRGAFSGGA